MTVGYPDWQRYPNWQSSNILPSYTVNHSAGTGQTGIKAVSNWQAVILRYVSTANFGQVTLSWYADSAGATLITEDTWLVSADTGLFVTVPCKGPFVRVKFNNTSGGTWSVNQMLVGTNVASPGLVYPVTNNSIIQSNVSVGAGATANFFLPWIKEGFAVFCFKPATGVTQLTPIVQQYSESEGATGQIMNIGTGNTANGITVALPPTPCGIRVINTDGAAAHTFTTSLITV